MCVDNEEDNNGNPYPILGKDTTEDDYEEALRVRSLDCCDQFDLECVRMHEEVDDGESNTNGVGCNHTETLVLSQMSAGIQEQIQLAVEYNTQEKLHTADEKTLLRKEITTMVDRMVEDEMGDIDDKQTIVTGIRNLIDGYFAKTSKKWAVNGGGAERLELYGHTGATAKNKNE